MGFLILIGAFVFGMFVGAVVILIVASALVADERSH